MAKRYPSFHPVPVHNSTDRSKSQYWQILNCARPHGSGEAKTREEVREALQDPINGLLKVSGEDNVGTRMSNDLLSVVIGLGLLDIEKEDDVEYIVQTEHGESYLNGEIDFGKTLRLALEYRMWKKDHHRGDQMLIELLLDIHKVMEPESQKYLSPSEILDRLDKSGWESKGYDQQDEQRGAKRNLRDALRFGALIQLFNLDNESGRPRYSRYSNSTVSADYNDDDDEDSQSENYPYLDSLRRICVYWQCEKVLRKLGTSNECFNNDNGNGEDFLHWLFVYHMYRVCGGLGNQRSHVNMLRKEADKFVITVREAYESDRSKFEGHGHINSDLPRPRKSIETLRAKAKGGHIQPGELLNTVNHHIKLLKIAIRSKFGLDSKQIPNFITVEALQQAYDCKEQEEVIALFNRVAGARYDVTILSDFAEKHRGVDWTFTKAFDEYKWQREATQKWFENDTSGIVAAVTASGKTVMAMYAISKYIEQNPKAVVSVIVPTEVLMFQWAETFAEILGLNEDVIGLRGAGFKDSFTSGKRVVISIVNSARLGVLASDVDQLPSATKHLMVADECHKFGGKANRTVFDARTDAILGLSATPPADEKQDDDDLTNSQVVLDKIGDVFYNLRYKEALEENLISEFEIVYVSIPLDEIDSLKYSDLSKKIGKSIQNIKSKYGHMMDRYSNRSLDEQLNSLAVKVPDINSDRDVFRYRNFAQKRRELVWETENRKLAYLTLTRSDETKPFTVKYEDKPSEQDHHINSQIMVFHERITQLQGIVASVDKREKKKQKRSAKEEEQLKLSREVNKGLEALAQSNKTRYGMYHSKQNPIWNSLFMQAFRENKCRVMLSVQALAEGVDVPKADVGIIRMSTGSVRKRIQTIGRMLRRGTEEKAVIYIFNVTTSDWKPTIDCNILRTVDWDEQLGDATIKHWRFIPNGAYVDTANHPGGFESQSIDILKELIPESWENRLPPAEVDVSELEFGDDYPGRFDGTPIGVDASGQTFLKNRDFGRLFIEDDRLEKAAKFVHINKGGGKILLTSQGHLITRVKGEPTAFLGTIDIEELHKLEAESLQARKDKADNKPRTFEEMFG